MHFYDAGCIVGVTEQGFTAIESEQEILLALTVVYMNRLFHDGTNGFQILYRRKSVW